MRRALAASAITVLMATGLSACLPTCGDMPAPSSEDKAAAAKGYEVERESETGATCELSRDGSQWNLDD